MGGSKVERQSEGSACQGTSSARQLQPFFPQTESAEFKRTTFAHLSLSTGNYLQLHRDILNRQEREVWGAKVINGPEAILPRHEGTLARHLKYMSAFPEALPEEPTVQAVHAQFTSYHKVAILERLASCEDRIWATICSASAIVGSCIY
jgi:hypothetical protein